MLKKIAFLCINPWEGFLSPILQGHIKDTYQLARNDSFLREDFLYVREKIEIYGDTVTSKDESFFTENSKIRQLLYVQTSNSEIIEKVFAQADLVFIGMSAIKKECDKIFLKVLPWKEKSIFLWNEHFCDKTFLRKIQSEYKLESAQIMVTKELPFYLTEALDSFSYESASEDASSSLFSGSGR